MARAPRPDAPGAVHHVMMRGIERRRIFLDDSDYEAFASRLDTLVPELGFRCFAWALLPNHVHLALQTGAVPLRRLMARLGTGFAGYFNRRHDRVGHVFQNRYRSRLVDGEQDLTGLVLYIHRNPLEAALVRDVTRLQRFPWCGHGALMGARAARPLESPSASLRLFGDSPGRARRRLGAAIQETSDAVVEPPSPDRQPLFAADPRPEPSRACLAELIAEVCRSHDIPPTAFAEPTRRPGVRQARDEICRRASRELGESGRSIARALGASPATVSRAIARED